MIDLDEAIFMRNSWIDTFVEMQYHMKPEEMKNVNDYGNPYGFIPPEEDDIEPEKEEKKKQLYRAVLINGMVRNRCSYNAACNTQFQGLVAYGMKLAGWNLLQAGYTRRLMNFVHDEFLYALQLRELAIHIPHIEALLIKGMRIAIPDVAIKVETTCSTHWDKDAKEYKDLKKDENGLPIIELPEFVKEAHKQANKQKEKTT